MDIGECLASVFSGGFFLAALLALSALPLLAASVFLFRRRPSFLPRPFLIASLLGLIAVVPAVSFQYLLPRLPFSWENLAFRSFVLVALCEEGAKYLVLRLGRRLLPYVEADGPAAGLSASLALALFETAAYAAANPSIALLRAVTAAPLHAACGIRVGQAAFSRRRALRSFLLAVFLHGLYDLSLLLPGYPGWIPVLLAYLALAVSLPLIERERDGDF